MEKNCYCIHFLMGIMPIDIFYIFICYLILSILIIPVFDQRIEGDRLPPRSDLSVVFPHGRCS